MKSLLISICCIMLVLFLVGCNSVKVFPKNSYMQSSALHQEQVKYIQPIIVLE